MGGFSYDRDDYGASSSWGSSYGSSGGSSYSSGGSSYSSMAASRMSASTLDESMLPNHRITSKSKHPIIIILDVTGSNIDLARIVYDKAPMLYGQIEQKKYLEDFDICFMAVGDVRSDLYPLQVGDFAKGIEIDRYLEKIVLESGGGGNDGESYELAAYYITHYMDLPSGAKPIVFFQGDEKTHGKPTKDSVTGSGIPDFSSDTTDVWKDLRNICNENVYMLLGKYNGSYWNKDIEEHWKGLLADERVIRVNEEKAIADLILGVVSMISNARDMESYKVDMLERGQTQKRIANVTDSLKNLSTALAVVDTNTTIAATTATKKTSSKAKRL